MKNQPNIILFMMDQLSAKWVEAGFAGAIRLPNMERLCRMGTCFDHAFTNNPVCSPARASVFTGLTCRSHRVMENGTALDPRIPTFPRILHENGWHTASFGKLHLLPHYQGPYHDYRSYGFDEVQEVADLYAGPWLDWVEKEHPEYYEKALTMVWPLEDVPGMRSYGKKGVDLVARARAAMEKHPYEHPLDGGQPVREVYTCPLPEGLTPTDWITRHATRYIRRQKAGPFFANISYIHPHNPFAPPARCLSAVDVDKMPEPLPATWQEHPGHPRHFDFPRSAVEIPPYWRTVRQYYFACIAHMDEQLGKILDTLEAEGIMENTYVLLAADHGELLYDHGFFTKHNRHYDACIRVPLMIAGPRLRAGAREARMVELLDLMPTILDMAGCPQPAPRTLPGYQVDEPYPSMLAGASLMPLLRGASAKDWRQEAYVESYSYWSNVRPEHWARTVRTPALRYTYYPQGGGEELFDLTVDPEELRNVSGDALYREQRCQMRDRLLERVILQDSPKDPVGPLFYHEHC